MIRTLDKLTLETERLLVRTILESDLKSIYQIHTDEQVNRYLPYDTWTCWNDALKWYRHIKERQARGDAQQFVILQKKDLSVVGTCIVFGFKSADSSCEIGYVLNRMFWRQGYMLEALSVLASHLLDRDEIQSLRAVVNSDNKSSLNVLDRLNFNVVTQLPDKNSSSSHLYLRSQP